jgi:hypothetical protein
MAVVPAITIPDADLADVVAALSIWEKDALPLVANQAAWDAMPDRAKVRLLLMAIIKTRTRNVRRERAERAISVNDVDAT